MTNHEKELNTISTVDRNFKFHSVIGKQLNIIGVSYNNKWEIGFRYIWEECLDKDVI